MSNKVFDTLRFLTEAGLPLLATALVSFGELLDIDSLSVSAAAVGIVNVFLAGILNYLRSQYKS
jgi:ribosome biogenesis protein Tsr3